MRLISFPNIILFLFFGERKKKVIGCCRRRSKSAIGLYIIYIIIKCLHVFLHVKLICWFLLSFFLSFILLLLFAAVFSRVISKLHSPLMPAVNQTFSRRAMGGRWAESTGSGRLVSSSTSRRRFVTGTWPT